jgi:hypothetical protein
MKGNVVWRDVRARLQPNGYTMARGVLVAAALCRHVGSWIPVSGGKVSPLDTAVNFPPVPHPDNQDAKANIFDRINHAVLPDANSIEIVVAL